MITTGATHTELLQAAGIELRRQPALNTTSHSKCPRCIERKGHSGSTVLAVTLKDDGVQVFCHSTGCEWNTGYFLKLTQTDRYKKIGTKQNFVPIEKVQPEPKTVTRDVFTASIARELYKENKFALWLASLYEQSGKADNRAEARKLAGAALQNWNVGTSVRPGKITRTVFWELDKSGRIRRPVAIPYGPDGKRLKRENGTLPDEPESEPLGFTIAQGYSPCLYGEWQLLQRPTDLVVLVESQKTAILASLAFPEFVWLAVGGKNISAQKAAALAGRDVLVLFDEGETEAAQSAISKLVNELAAQGMQPCTAQAICHSDLLGTTVQKGFDLAEYIAANPSLLQWPADYPGMNPPAPIQDNTHTSPEPPVFHHTADDTPYSSTHTPPEHISANTRQIWGGAGPAYTESQTDWETGYPDSWDAPPDTSQTPAQWLASLGVDFDTDETASTAAEMADKNPALLHLLTSELLQGELTSRRTV